MDHRLFCPHFYRIFLGSMLLLSACNYSKSAGFSSLGVENSKLVVRREFFGRLTGSEQNNEVFIQDKSWSFQFAEVDKTANSYASAKVRLNYYVKGLYQNTEPPYPGAVSAKEQCPQNYLPNFYPERSSGEIELFAVSGRGTSRNVLGACDEQSAKSTILKIVLHCRQSQRVFELDVWGPYPNFSTAVLGEILAGFSCKN